MESAYKVFIVTLLFSGIVFARSERNNPRLAEKKVKTEYNWVKDQSEYNDDNKLDRKRSHKRRRKIRKPVKGLR